MFFGKRSLAVAVEAQQKTELLLQIPDCVNGNVDAKMNVLRVGDRDSQYELAASIELFEERLAIE